MLAKNVSMSDLENALEKVNEKFEGNIRFKEIRQQGRNIRFTLTVNSSRGKGGRWNHDKSRRVAAACWHAHGEFFDSLPDEAVIVANGEKIRPGDTWKDQRMGSLFCPVYYSELCDC
jgi:hypothetical protein